MKLSIVNVIERIPSILRNIIFYKPIFGSIGWHSVIKSPLRLECCHNIYLGNVYVGYKVWLAANPLTGITECKLVIKNGCHIGNFNHIYATGELIIEDNVLTADKVFISDNMHGYENIGVPIHKQPIKQNGKVTIGAGSWLGENVCVLGASIGKNCVIGSNSVVTNDIPDYSVAVGAPAKVIKKYDFERKEWIKC